MKERILMAKKKTDNGLNLESILFNCRNHLRAARNSGSFFEKRDMMLTLVFLRFIGEKYENGVASLKQRLIDEGFDIEDENIISAFFEDASFGDGTYYLPYEARWSTIINTPAPKLNVALDTALKAIAESNEDLKGCFTKHHDQKATWAREGLFGLHFQTIVHHWRESGQELKQGLR